MKKNVRDYKVIGVQFAYVLNSIYVENEATGEEVTGLTDEQLVQWVFAHYYMEFDNAHNRRLYPNEMDRLEQWLRGLPSCINLAFTNYDIAQVGKSWGYCQTPAKEAKFVENWFNVMAQRLLQLRRLLCDD